MANRRDIELLISARDTTGRTFQNVAGSIRDLNTQIEAQVDKAKKGEVALDELRASQRALADLGRDLSAIQGQIDAYRRLEDTLDSNKKAFAAAETGLAEYKRGLGDMGNITAAQERKLGSLEAKVVTTGQAIRKTEADLIGTSQALKQAGIDTDNLANAQAQVVAAARATGSGLSSLKGAVSTYAADLQAARLSETQLAQATGLDQKIAEATRLGDASKFVRIYADAVDQVHLADQRLAALNGFRAVGQQAAEASRDVSRFVTAGEQMAISSSQVAAGLRGILQPGAEALRTLDGVEAAIQEAAATAERDKGSITDYSNAINRLSEASAAALRLGALSDTFRDQEAQLGRSRAAFDQQAAEVERLGLAMARADQPTEELTRDLAQAEAKLTTLGKALALDETKLGQLSRELKIAGVSTTDMAADLDRLDAAARRAASGLDAGNKTLGRGGGKAGGLFGLDPFQLQQLSFQVNDVFVSLASGQKPLTVLLQQGAQIGQLFPAFNAGLANILSTLGPFLIALGAVAAALAPFAIAFAVVGGKVTETQQAIAKLDLRGLSNVDPSGVIRAADALEKAGASAEEADEAISSVLDTVSDPAAFDTITAAAAEMAEKLGIDVPEATELLVGVMNGGIEATEALAESTHLLTNEELDHAQALFDAGNAAEARQYILDTVTQKLADQASLTDGVFTPAVNNLKTAFGNLVGFFERIAAPVLDWFSGKIKNAIVGFTYLTGLVAGKDSATAGREAVTAVFGAPRQAGAGGAGRPATAQDVKDRAYRRELEAEVSSTRKLTSAERVRRAEIDARRKAQAAGVSKGVEDLAVTQAIAGEQRKIAQEAEKANKKGAKTRASAAAKAQREAEALRRKIEAAQKQAENQLGQLRGAASKTGSASLEDRLAAVDEKYESIYETLAKLRDLGVTQLADGTSFADVEKEVAAQKEILKQHERIADAEEEINLLTAQRKDEIETITDAQERGAKSVGQAFKEAEAVNGRLSPQIVDAARKALEVARQVAGTKPSAEMVSLIARLERIIGGEPVNNIAGDVLEKAFADQESKLNDILGERNTLADSYNVLRELGLKTDQEARELTAKAYQDTAPAIQAQLTAMRSTLEILRQTKDALTGLPLVSDAAYNAWLAKLQATEAGLVKVDDRITQVNQAAQQGIANGVANAFKVAADTIVGLVAGTLSFGDALDNVIGAGLSLLGSFLDAIAQVLVQMVALQAAKAILGAGTGGLGALFFHGGGKVGTGGTSRKRTGMSESWFGAPKFHSGGGLGLRADEYKAVLKRGEEVLTENDPRHISNIGRGGGSGAPAPALRQVLLLEGDQVASAMQTRAGEKAVLTIIRANKPTLKQILS